MKLLTGEELAKEMNIPLSKLKATLDEYNEAAKNPNGPANKYQKKFFNAMPWDANDKFNVCIITPVVHYCMGGVAANEFAQVLTPKGAIIPGLYVAGEAQGGVHGTNRLGGSSLLDCVVYGRISGRSSTKFLLDKLVRTGGAGAPGAALAKSAGGISATVRVNNGKVTLELDTGASGSASQQEAAAADAPKKAAGFQEEDPNAAFYGKGFGGAAAAAPAAAAAAPAAPAKKSFTLDEVKKHNKDTDCWVILHNQVYDVTKFLNDHPGGKKAILLYAGKDATTEFDMLHSKDLLARYGPDFHIGALAGGAKL
jgi:cytochrome b involved in lipid metabolism